MANTSLHEIRLLATHPRRGLWIRVAVAVAVLALGMLGASLRSSGDQEPVPVGMKAATCVADGANPRCEALLPDGLLVDSEAALQREVRAMFRMVEFHPDGAFVPLPGGFGRRIKVDFAQAQEDLGPIHADDLDLLTARIVDQTKELGEWRAARAAIMEEEQHQAQVAHWTLLARGDRSKLETWQVGERSRLAAVAAQHTLRMGGLLALIVAGLLGLFAVWYRPFVIRLTPRALCWGDRVIPLEEIRAMFADPPAISHSGVRFPLAPYRVPIEQWVALMEEAEPAIHSSQAGEARPQEQQALGRLVVERSGTSQ